MMERTNSKSLDLLKEEVLTKFTIDFEKPRVSIAYAKGYRENGEFVKLQDKGRVARGDEARAFITQYKAKPEAVAQLAFELIDTEPPDYLRKKEPAPPTLNGSEFAQKETVK